MQLLITPRACTRGKAIGFVCRLSSVVTTKIARSRVLGICACCNYNESVDIGEKLVSVCFELLNVAPWCYKSCIFRSACLWFTNLTHSMYDVTRLDCACSTSVQVRVAKSWSAYSYTSERSASILAIYFATMAVERAGYVLWRALVILGCFFLQVSWCHR